MSEVSSISELAQIPFAAVPSCRSVREGGLDCSSCLWILASGFSGVSHLRNELLDDFLGGHAL